MSDLYISLALHSSHHSTLNDKSIAGSFTHQCTHLHIFSSKQWVWSLQASSESRRRASSTLLIKTDSVSTVISLWISPTLCQTEFIELRSAKPCQFMYLLMTSCLYQTFLNTINKEFLEMKMQGHQMNMFWWWCFYIHILPQLSKYKCWCLFKKVYIKSFTIVQAVNVNYGNPWEKFLLLSGCSCFRISYEISLTFQHLSQYRTNKDDI